jgi:hypothetical protein
VEQARAAPGPADAYTPNTVDPIADPSTDAANMLRQLPGMVEVEALVTCPQPTHRIIHLRDWHHVPRDLYALDRAHALCRPLSPEALGLRYEELLLQVELVQRERLSLQRCLIRHHGLKRVLSEGLRAGAGRVPGAGCRPAAGRAGASPAQEAVRRAGGQGHR